MFSSFTFLTTAAQNMGVTVKRLRLSHQCWLRTNYTRRGFMSACTISRLSGCIIFIFWVHNLWFSNNCNLFLWNSFKSTVMRSNDDHHAWDHAVEFSFVTIRFVSLDFNVRKSNFKLVEEIKDVTFIHLFVA